MIEDTSAPDAPVTPPRINREVVAEMHAQNMSLSAISAHFDVTRERIRQVVRELGLKPRLEVIAERNAQLLREAKDDVEDEELAAKFEISVAMVGLIKRQNGASATEARNLRLAAALQKVEEGTSIRAAAMEFDVSPGTLASRAHDAKVQIHHGRWGALAHRKEMITAMVRDGLDWYKIVARLSEHERRDITSVTLRVWMKNHMPEIDISKLHDLRVSS